jgi:peptidoglycan biosynthesis protein MviN/MurJ (putative lipid II flippase)
MLTVASRLVNALKEIAIAYRFGATEMVDAYVLVFAFVTWLPAVWLSLLQTVFVPQAVRMNEDEREDFVAELFGWVIVAGAFASVLLAVGLPELVLVLTPAHPGADELRAFAWQMAPVALLGLVTSQLIALLVIEKKHNNALLEGVPGALILILVVWQGSVLVLGLGTLAGFALQVAVALALLAPRGMRGPRLSTSAPSWRRFLGAVRIAAIGQLLLALAYPVDQLIANTMDAGDAARFAYAYRLVAFVMAIGSLAIGRVVLPVLSEWDYEKSWQITSDWALRVVLLGVTMAVGAWLVAPWLVQLLFERGAFTSADSEVVTSVFRYGLLQIPALFAGVLLTQFLASREAYLPISVIAAMGALTKIVLSVGLGMAFGLEGLMIASALAYVLTAVLSLLAARRMNLRRGGWGR